jgi:hypothetical protein
MINENFIEACRKFLKPEQLLLDAPMADIRERALDLRYTEGKKFFDPSQASVFPERDFWLCTEPDRFHGVIRVRQSEEHLYTEWIPQGNF